MNDRRAGLWMRNAVLWSAGGVLLTIWAWAGLLLPGYFLKAHDAQHTIMFLIEFAANLRAGVIYPRWGPDFALGYGYPLFTFYAPFVYYIASGFHLIGFGILESIKLTFISGFLLSAAAMYLFVNDLWGKRAGILAALVYTYAPYHIADVYVRGALAEFWAFVWFPLIFWSFYRLVLHSDRRDTLVRNTCLAGLTFAGLLFTHNGTALVFSAVLAVYFLMLLYERYRRTGTARQPVRIRLRSLVLPLAAAAASGVLALLLTGIFWLPLVGERTFIRVDQWIAASYDYRNHFVHVFQYVQPLWDFGYSDGLNTRMPFQLGLAPLLLGGLALFAIRFRRSHDGTNRLIVFWAAVTFAVALMMLNLSAPVWAALPLAALVQFPWRILSMTTLLLAILAGGAARLAPDYLSRSTERLTAGSAAVLLPALMIAIVFSYTFTVPQVTPVAPEQLTPALIIEFEMHSTRDRVGMMAWTRTQPDSSPLVEQYLEGSPLIKADAPEARVETQVVRPVSVDVLVDAAAPTVLTFYTYYYPGWRGFLDGQEVAITPDPVYGLITMQVPAGRHNAGIRYQDTPLRTAATAVSVSGVAVLLLLLGYSFREQRRQR